MKFSVLPLLAVFCLTIKQLLAGEQHAVTCGSVVKLIHKETGNHLHSHAIAWGSGSGQQSVTATGTANDPNSLWLIKEGSTSSKTCELAAPVQCGSVIRLEHSSSGKNLHSHLFRAPLSGNQEVSGFGEGGVGDTGDNWIVECDRNDKYWTREAPVAFRHVDTGKYLFTADHVKFNQQNCGGGCPIMGQTEISAAAKKDVRAKWVTGQGVYFPPKNTDGKSRSDEL